MHWLSWEPLCEPHFLVFCIKSSIGTQDEVGRLWKFFKPPGVILLTVLRRWSWCYSYLLLLCDLFYEALCFKSCLVLFCSCFLRPFSNTITSHGEERASLNAFRTFLRFALVWFCLFPFPLGVWEGLRLVIVAHPGLLSFYFLDIYRCSSYVHTVWCKKLMPTFYINFWHAYWPLGSRLWTW